jgi:hypothetical protein
MSIALTMLTEAVEPSTDEMLKFEQRLPKDSIIKAFADGTTSVINESAYKEAKASLRRPVNIAVLKTEAFTVNSVRQITPTPNIVGSDKVSLNFSTLAFSFLISEPLNQDNYISYLAEFKQAIFNGIVSAMLRDNNSLESKLYAYLEANKWSALPDSTVRGVSTGAGAYEMSPMDYTLNAPVVMQELEMFPRFMDIGNIGAIARQRDVATYGKYNSRDLDQYQTEMDYYNSNKVVVTPGKDESHFVIPKGALGLVNWIEWDARNRTVVHDGQFETVVDPFFGFDWGVFVTKGRADVSGQGGVGLERASNIRYDFAASFAPVSPYSSIAGTSPIVKFDLVQA